MSRREFIESYEATCDNWQWSWSFINEDEKFIIFGTFDINEIGNLKRIFSKDWEISNRGARQPGYSQSREHIRLIEEEGYQLKTFSMQYAPTDENDAEAPARIVGFIPELTDKVLIRDGNDWYASDQTYGIRLPEEIDQGETYMEGASKTITVVKYERSAVARSKCLEHHGYKCAVCSFDFYKTYGLIGFRYIHVHHVIPLAEVDGEYELDPINDLIPVCPNCHAMIHLKCPALGIEKLQQYIEQQQ
jgi:5-methylcytosine-specific restriction protein A